MRVLHVGDDFAALRPCGLTLYSDALMRAQAAAGHEVTYVFSGRHYPRLSRPRLKRWRSGAIEMVELVGSPSHAHWEGSDNPLLDLQEPVGEATFASALRASRPQLVHIHELARLPSSVIDQARAAGVPIVMTLHDYKSVCATVRLVDADGQRCSKRIVGSDCARNCGDVPGGRAHLVDATMRYERGRLKRALPLGHRINFARADPVVGRAMRLLQGPPNPQTTTAEARVRATPDDYQRRRDVNVERLGLCDRLIAPSARVAEIYGALGVDRRLIAVQRLTLPHLERLWPRHGPHVTPPLTFVTLGGCASITKGSRVVVEAARLLEREHGGRYRLVIHGPVESAAEAALACLPSVTVAGPYEPADLDRLLDDADVGLLPSVWEETHGFVGVEMLAKGLPVIGSDLGGIPEYVHHGETGWLNRSAGAVELAALMAAAIDNLAEVSRLRSCVRARRDEFVRPMSAHVAEVDALYAELVRDTRHANARRRPPRSGDSAVAARPSS